MADKRCNNGHYIDESWDLCPYCPVAEAPEVPAVVRPGRADAPQSAPERPAPIPIMRSEMTVTDAPAGERTVVVVPSASRGVEADPTRRYVVGWLVCLTGATRGEAFPVRMGRNVLGRDKRADVVVNDEQASAHHADLVFRPEEGRFILMDHNSTNGTYVNEAELEPRRDLNSHDVVRIGAHRLLFVPLCAPGHMWDSEGELA